MMIDPKLFTVESLLSALLCSNDSWRQDMYNDTWRVHATIVPDYMPPYPGKDTRPRCVVRCGDAFLRHSAGPSQGFFWDVYGDDMLNPGLALVALLHAPVPPFFLKRPADALRDSEGFGSVTFSLPLKPPI